MVSRLQAHKEEVCGLKWSEGGNVLASGGNDNLLYIWDSSKMNSSRFLFRFREHSAAVKALAWCPYQSEVLASGGGTEDGCIKLWNTKKGTCIKTIETNAQASYRIRSPFCELFVFFFLFGLLLPAISSRCISRSVDWSGTGTTRRF